METSNRLKLQVRLAFGSAILVLLVLGGMSYRGIAVSSESRRMVRHTQEVLEKLQNLLLAMESIDSSSREFVLTGEESYLEIFRASSVSERQDEATVRNLTVDNPEQQRRLPALETLAVQRIQFAEMLIRLRRSNGLAAAADAMPSGPGPRGIDEFQGVVSQLRNEELRLLVLRDADSNRRLGQTKTVLILGTFLGILIAAGATWIILHDNSGRVLAENALRESEERNRKILDGIVDYGIMTMDPKGQILSWNAGAERIVGYRADKVIGQNFSLFFPAEDIERGRPAEILRMTAANGRLEDQSKRIRQDGSRYTNIVVYRALMDPAGTLQGFSAVGHPQTESEEAGAKYQGLLEAAPDGMVVVDQGGEIVLLNVQAEKQFGYRRHELVGQKVKNIIPEGFEERLIADALRSSEDALAQQIGTGIELLGKRKDGSEFPIEIMLSPLENAEGILVTAAIRDITERRRADQEIRKSEERFRLLVEDVKDYAILMLDPNGLVASWNVGAERIKGYRAEEIIGQHFSRFYPPEVAAEGIPEKELVQAAELGRIEDEGWRLRKDNSRFWASVVISALRDNKDELLGFSKVTRDISERRRLEQQLRQAHKM